MVQTWLSLRNDDVRLPCLNKHATRIFQKGCTLSRPKVYFYGDYDLDIFIGTKNDYANLEAVATKIIAQRRGWVRHCRMEDSSLWDIKHLDQVVALCGHVPERELKKMFPRREDCTVLKCFVLRRDGNFFMCACETSRFYYVVCFATS